MGRKHGWWMTIVGLFALVVVSVGSHVSAAGPQRVSVCHLEETGDNAQSFRLISVPASAVAAHLKHGDAQPGDPVPGSPGLFFDDTCGKVSACPCDLSVQGLAAIGIDGGACVSTIAGGPALVQGSSFAGVSLRVGQEFCFRRGSSPLLEVLNLTTPDEIQACTTEFEAAVAALNITTSCP